MLIHWLVVVALSFFVSSTNALYEDQIGKFDWRQKFVGNVKFAYFDSAAADKAILATDENVLAAVSSKDGEILWRKVLETEDSRGEIKFLHVITDLSAKSVTTGDNFGIITVSGNSPVLIRGWDTRTGNLAFEWSLTPLTENSDSLYFYKDSKIYHVVPVWKSHIELTEYHATTGQQDSSTTRKITAGWISKSDCVLNGDNFACITKNQLLVIDLLTEQNNLRTKTVDTASPIATVRGEDGFVQIGQQIISLKDLQVIHENKNQANLFMDQHLIQLVKDKNNVKISVDEQEIALLSDVPETLDNDLKILSTKCKQKKENNQIVCRFLLSTDDGALALAQQGKIKWIREEALTKIDAVEFLDLTLSDAQGAIEEELNSKDADIWNSLSRRLHSQYGTVKNIVLHVLGFGAPPSFSQRAGLVRDDFGLHKMMVIMTKSGKLFGIDSVSGKQHWVRMLSNFEGFGNEQNMKLLVQRTSRYYPLSAQCAVVAREKSTGNGILYQFNPISGQSVNGGIKKLAYKIKQVSLLPKSGENFLRGMLFIDEKTEVHVLPETSLAMADDFFFYIVYKQTGNLAGYKIQYENNKAKTLQVWTLNLGGSDNEQKITQIGAKNSVEKVHSLGRVLADRSVLYKYVNPNLIAVTTEGPDSIHKYILNVYLIDVVSGNVVFTMNHRRVKGPVQIVHSENWLVYSFYNDKLRRNEITSIELYEGKTQLNSTVWSSLNSPPMPLVERQTFIISGGVAALRETITEKGITNKHVLIGLTSGAVTEMAWALLDPRRQSMIAPEKQREEGIIPYIPELPLQHENFINYNQTVAKISGIYSAPSGLESTCLALVYGLDLFVTRVSPSKTFDLLKEDFDYAMISIVLIGLTSASYIVKHLAAKKAIKQAWK